MSERPTAEDLARDLRPLLAFLTREIDPVPNSLEDYCRSAIRRALAAEQECERLTGIFDGLLAQITHVLAEQAQEGKSDG